jgi:hypothetical protein
MPPNLPMAYGLSDIQGSDSLRTARWQRLLEAMADRTSPSGEPDPYSRLLDLVATRYIYTPRELDTGARFELVQATEGNLYLNRQARPRAWCVARCVGGPNASAARAAILDPRFNPGDSVVLGGVAGGDALRQACGQPTGIASEGPNRVTIAGPCGPGWLVLADAYYPGWRAAADGEETKVWEADWVLRGVDLKRSASRVEFVYWPASFVVGQFVTLLSAFALVALVSATWRRKR